MDIFVLHASGSKASGFDGTVPDIELVSRAGRSASHTGDMASRAARRDARRLFAEALSSDRYRACESRPSPIVLSLHGISLANSNGSSQPGWPEMQESGVDPQETFGFGSQPPRSGHSWRSAAPPSSGPRSLRWAPLAPFKSPDLASK